MVGAIFGRRRISYLEMTRGERVFEVFNVLFLLFLVVITVYPLYFVLIASVSESSRMMTHTGVMLWPKGFSLESYQRVVTYPMITVGYVNTLIYVFAGTALNVLLTAMAAYALSRRNVMFAGLLMIVITFTWFFSGGLIPNYLLIERLGLTDTRAALILWKAVQPWNLIIMRTAFAGIPDDIVDSARIDGAGHMRIFSRIAIPMSTAVMAVMVLFYGVYHWNSWFYSMVFLRSRKLYPLQLVLREILIINDTGTMTADVGDMSSKDMVALTIKYATIIISTVPIMCLYPFLQNYFVKGVMVGAIKG